MITKIIAEELIQKAKKYVEKGESFAIVTHVSPDGDALGSEKWKDTAVELAAEVERVRVVDLKVEDVADDHHLEDHPSADEEEENEPDQKPHVNLTI